MKWGDKLKLVGKQLNDNAALSGRLTVAVYGPEMDELVAQYGLMEAERMLEPVRVIQEANKVVLTGRNLIRNFLNGTTGLTGVEYYAIGTSTGATVAGTTALGAEAFRAAPTQKITADGSLTIKLYVATGEANGSTMAEAGPFCNGATTTADSGTLYARSLYTKVAKSASKALVYTHELLFSSS